MPEILGAKRKLFEAYNSALESITSVRMAAEPAGTSSNYWLQLLILDKKSAHLRDDLLKAMNDDGCCARACWSLLSTFPMYADCPRMDLTTSESMTARTINIPSGVGVGKSI